MQLAALKRATVIPAFSAAAACAMFVVLALAQAALAVPQYSAQAGRTCDTCHILPDWDTPKLAHQKRNMSCGTCHVDPSGGGMRTTTGRYYGRATLPMIATSPRPQDDWDRNFPGLGRRDKATPYESYLPVGPRDIEHAPAYRDSLDDKWAWGTPKGITPDTPWPGRHFKLNPDPMLRIGGDFRFAALASKTSLFFPMQFDVHTAAHPVHHATVLMNVGARGQSSGYSDTIDDSHTPYFRELFVMTHEWPYQTYAKAGRFVPAFGLKLDDHTTRTRREFELDTSLPETRVLGAEVGAVAAYPFFQASYFKMKSKFEVPDQWDIFDVDDGWGTAFNAGWRDLGWSAGASALVRRRPLGQGGDSDTYALYASFNPWYFWARIPLTIQGEIDYGQAQRASGLDQHKLVMYGEMDWAVWNGVTLLAAYDWADPDRDVRDDESGRAQLGGQVTVYPGITLDGRFRFLHVATPSGDGTDFFTQLHLWF
jgi:hypothetical protein